MWRQPPRLSRRGASPAASPSHPNSNYGSSFKRSEEPMQPGTTSGTSSFHHSLRTHFHQQMLLKLRLHASQATHRLHHPQILPFDIIHHPITPRLQAAQLHLTLECPVVGREERVIHLAILLN